MNTRRVDFYVAFCLLILSITTVSRISSAMVSENQIRTVAAMVADETDPEKLEQLLAALTMLSPQYLRERSHHVTGSTSSGNGGPNRNAA